MFRITNVRGDGSCFYRCVWRVACASDAAAQALFLQPDEVADEELGVREIRQHVAWLIENDSRETRETIDALLALAGASECINDLYPLLDAVDPEAPYFDNIKGMADMVRLKDTYASEVEVCIVQRELCDAGIALVVVSCESFSDLELLGEKWLRELDKLLPSITSPKLCTLINEGNSHYRLGKFCGDVVADTEALRTYVQDRMNSDSD